MIKSDPKNPRGIVWLASYPKSGNTWLRIYLYQLMRIMGGHPRDENELNKLDRASGYETLLIGLFEQLLGRSVTAVSQPEVMKVRPRVHAAVAERIKGVALLKTHNLLGEIDGVPTVNPQVTAGAIYIVRDPRDVASSLATNMGSTIDQAIEVMGTSRFATPTLKEAVFEIWGSWSEHVESWTVAATPALLVVRYEDMLASPTETFTSIAHHLRQAATPAQVTEAIELSSFDRLKRQDQESPFRERSSPAQPFFVTGTAGGWRDRLTAAQADRIVAAHRTQMERFGYLD
jgi:hypothetical protein